MLRHACSYALADKGHDTRALQAYSGTGIWRHYVELVDRHITCRDPHWMSPVGLPAATIDESAERACQSHRRAPHSPTSRLGLGRTVSLNRLSADAYRVKFGMFSVTCKRRASKTFSRFNPSKMLLQVCNPKSP
jgi:hypothetical protein